jgi:hypothetical protein
VSDRSNQRVEVFTHCGVFLREFGDQYLLGTGPGGIALYPSQSLRGCFASSPERTRVYVTDLGHDRVVVFHRDGSYLREFPDRANPQQAPPFMRLNGVSIHEDKIYISERNGKRVQLWIRRP